MVTHLSSLDYERKRNVLSFGTKKKKETTSSTTRRQIDKEPEARTYTKNSTYKPALRLSTHERSRNVGNREPSVPLLRRTTSVVPNATPAKEQVCYNCGKPGHFRPECPEPAVKEIDAEDDKTEVEPDSEQSQSENEEA
jgi:hypothetical protein